MLAQRWAQALACLGVLVCSLPGVATAAARAQPLAKVDPGRKDIQPVADRYAIVTNLPPGDPYREAAEALAKHRGAALTRIPFSPPEALIKALQGLRAAQIAFVARPEAITANLVSAVYLASATMDHDPELEFAYGFLTGATPKDALALVRRTLDAEKGRAPRRAVCTGHVFDGMDHCYKAMEDRARQYTRLGFQAETIRFEDKDRQWNGRKAAELAKLDGATCLVFCGHGDGEMSCGIEGRDLARARLSSAVVFNGTCFANALVTRWNIGPGQKLRLEKLAPQASVALGLIRAGAVGIYGSTVTSGYINVLPAEVLVQSGVSMGEAFRRSQDENVRRAQLAEPLVYAYRQGEQSPQFRGTEKEQAANSISPVALIGDPAYVPYPGGIPGAEQLGAPGLPPSPAPPKPDPLLLTPGRHEFVLSPNNGIDTMVIEYLKGSSWDHLACATVADNGGVRTLLRFDLSRVSVAEGADLKRATLRLYREKAPSLGDTGATEHRVGLHRVLGAWGPGLTWGKQPPFEEAPFVTLPYEQKTGWLEVDVTPQARAWLAQPEGNHGVLLKFAGEGLPAWVGWDLATAEAPDAARHPRLVFECE